MSTKTTTELERLYTEARYQTRQQNDEGGLTVSGYAALYNSISEDLGGFREIILPGAFQSVMARNPDIRALINHDTGRVIGRTRSGTLRLSEDETGLAFSVDLPETPEGRAIFTSIQRRDITGASFAFNIGFEDYDVRFEGDELIREINNISQLYEVSVVAFPAYSETSVSTRHANHILGHVKPSPRSAINSVALRLNLLKLSL